jgi:hypothetical protein
VFPFINYRNPNNNIESFRIQGTTYICIEESLKGESKAVPVLAGGGVQTESGMACLLSNAKWLQVHVLIL